MKNYRPITNFSFLRNSRKTVARQLLEHIDKVKLFNDFQSAYREGHSVECFDKIKNDIELFWTRAMERF